MAKKLFFITLGIIIFSVIIYYSDPYSILEKLIEAKYKIFLFLLPYIPVIILDTIGWQLVLITKEKKYNFIDLLQMKLVGDFIKRINPAGALAADVVKAHILKPYGVSFVEGIASLYIGKLLMAKGQIIFILTGIIISFLILAQEHQTLLVAGLAGVIVLIILITISYIISLKKGLFNLIYSIFNKLGINVNRINKYKETLDLFDEKVRYFYNHQKKKFLLSLICFTAGWIISSFEIYVVLNLMDINISFSHAIIIESLSSIITGLIFFIPGSLGIQEGGILLFFNILGYLRPDAVFYAIIKRIRELFWLGLGVAFLGKFDFSISKSKVNTTFKGVKKYLSSSEDK